MNKNRLIQRFMRYCACPSESGNEREFALLIEKELQELGLETWRDEIGDKCKIVISTELSMGQMLTDVKSAVAGRWKCGLINRTGGIVPSSLEIVERAIKLWEEAK